MTFHDDLTFLKKHVEVIVLNDDKDQAGIIVVPEWQGRVMTSTASGKEGMSFGWINRELIASGEIQKHINVFGGEDRFWLGPEGGQYSIFFKPGVPFEFDHWFTPAEIDTEPFEIVSRTQTSARFKKNMKLINYSGNIFELNVRRDVNLFKADEIGQKLGITIGEGVQMVGYETENSITNTGSNSWTEKTGMLSIWILGMFNPSPKTTVVVPYKEGPESRLGKIVTDDYFGAISPERLKIQEGILYFKADGESRGKIGVSPGRAKPVMGSYDEENKVLTIVEYTLPPNVTRYVNSLWKFQKNPFAGDAANSYNDGPLDDGSQLGPFYELESSSPAAALAPGEVMRHTHRTFHFTGDRNQLNMIAKNLLGVGLDEIASAF
ncbi:DUF6786 family protein [bacterium]